MAYLKPVLSRRSMVKCVDYAGAPSCMNLALCLNASCCFFCHGRKFFCRKSMSVFQLILTPSGTLNEPTRVSWTMPAQNITPPPPCWHHIRMGIGIPVLTQAWPLPSGPSRVARHLSVKMTVSKLSFMYSFNQNNRLSPCFLDKTGCFEGFTLSAIWCNTLFQVNFDTFCIPASLKICALVPIELRKQARFNWIISLGTKCFWSCLCHFSFD